jgi:iron complex transport system permease protein
LGTSGGAALGATLGIVIGSSEILGPYRLSLYAFVGAAMSISLVYIVASRGAFSIHTMILGGVILSFLFSSLVLLIFALVQVEKIHSVLRWLMGDLSTAENSLIPVVAIIILGGILLLSIWGRKIDILTLGDEKAISLGIVPNSTRKGIFILVSLIVGVCVSATGIIGFVGLIIPHFMRWTFSPGHRALIPASALAGSIYLCLSDTLARTIIHPIELPVGVVTGIIGGLFFLGILVSSRWRLSR